MASQLTASSKRIEVVKRLSPCFGLGALACGTPETVDSCTVAQLARWFLEFKSLGEQEIMK